ncbi:fibronectin type III domain-containing protein, partial [Streptomyces sp. NPDC005921]
PVRPRSGPGSTASAAGTAPRRRPPCTPASGTGGARVTGYRVTVSDGRAPIDVTGRDVLVTQPSAKGMFRVIGGLTPGTAYTVTVAAVTAAGVGPAATVTASTRSTTQ